MKDVINHGRRLEWDVYGRLSSAPCLCDRCEGRRTLGAALLLIVGAASSVGFIVWACFR